MSKKVLGKGLESLLSLPQIPPTESNDRIINIPINSIVPNPLQPRQFFDEKKIKDLANSVREKGVIQPIIVTKKNDFFEVVVGERRWRACQLLEMELIPAIVKEASGYELLELALVENIQRQDLNSIEEAISYKELIENLELTQEQLSIKIGKSRASIANTMRLLKLPNEIQKDISQDRLTEGHGRALLALKNGVYLNEIRHKVINSKLSVRDTEKVVQNINDGFLDGLNKLNKEMNSKNKNKKKKNFFVQRVLDVEEKLNDILDTEVKVRKYLGSERGKIEIRYKNEREFSKLLKIFGVKL